MAMTPRPLTEYLEAKRVLERVREEVGPTIVAMRSSSGLTQTQVSSGASLTQGYLSAVENGHKMPTPETLERIIQTINSAEGGTSGQEEDPAT